ncbi:CBS domain-containing protein [Nonomuraea africana]|uniref:CBS domain-containing protein n=1 Tax=Nonomuraea africana TaxID=46171 RepID=A0ABR9KL91_9ACTN|nr:CBS domain-containing protein [Nonomuraea africana]MBE1562784.1 CBS domain-containing protein [Nonomuraea africana]
MMQKVREIMTPAPVSLPSGATLAEAAKQMRDHHIGDVLVVDDDRLMGIVTDRDIVVRAVAEGSNPRQTSVGEVCSREDLTCVSPQDDAEEAVALMRRKAIRRIPVLEDGRPVGVVSLGDLALERDSRSALADISAAPANN